MIHVIDVIISARHESIDMIKKDDIDAHVITEFRWKKMNVKTNVMSDKAKKCDWIETDIDL